jgi:4'-phosphopantetheinyl transferase
VPLGAGEVQVWKARTTEDDGLITACREMLAKDELERMQRTRAGNPRDEFVVGRGLLRMLVGNALGREPASIAFGHGAHGKPHVEGLEFNVSHSRGLVLIALCRNAAVGVDVEWCDPRIEALEIARGSFAEEEIAWLRSLPAGADRIVAFYDCWTRKEAVTKAHGDGLTMALASFSVVPKATGEVLVSAGYAGVDGGQSFFMQALDPHPGYAGALAVSKAGRAIRCYEYGLKGARGGVR